MLMYAGLGWRRTFVSGRLFMLSHMAIIWASNIWLSQAVRAAGLPKTFLATVTVNIERLQ
jgi:hypothetical protein